MTRKFVGIFFFIIFISLNSLHATSIHSDNRVSIAVVDPMKSPTEFYQNNPGKIGMIPDGTGLQILFHSNGHYYLIGGPRSGRLLTVNGGKIENPQAPFVKQLQEEFHEETFGLIQINNQGEKLILTVNQHHYPLVIQKDKTLIVEKPGQFAYVTFTAVVEGLDLDEIQDQANIMKPTALFWERIGSFLYPHVRSAPKDEQFSAYWQQLQPVLNQFLMEQTEIYDRLIQDGHLLITPEQAFETSSLEAAWEQLRNLSSFAQLKNCFQNTVGRYSERKGYFVFDASNLLKAGTEGSTNVLDVNGETVAQGLFNLEAVTHVFPLIL